MKIPDGAKLVFKGVIFEVYQWQQKMFDGSLATFEMLKRPDTVQVIPIVGDKILIAEEQQPTKEQFHGLFGGRVEESEHPLDAAKREFLEESGYEAQTWETLKVYTPYHKMDWTMYMFVARNCHQVQKPQLDPGERIFVKEVSFDEFIDLVISKQFWGKEFSLDVLHMKLDGQLAEFQSRLFGP